MFNAEIPSRAELPSSRQLLKSTVIAVVAAAVILVTIVLPAEYALDPTGVGRALQLTQMGEIKKQLSIEAEADRQRDRQQAPTTPAAPERRSSLGAIIGGLLVSPAQAHPGHGDDDEAAPAGNMNSRAIAQPVTGGKTDETVITLKPNEGVEYKLTMARGAVVEYSWKTDGGNVNYDLHGSPKGGGKETSYKKGRGVATDSGTLMATYDGSHGWFWRNRGTRNVTITLKTTGAYSDIKRMN